MKKVVKYRESYVVDLSMKKVVILRYILQWVRLSTFNGLCNHIRSA